MSKQVIESLTEEQKAKIPEYYEKFLKIGLSTEPCNRAKAEEYITRAYAYQKMPAPQFVWVDSPYQGAKLAAQEAKGSQDVTTEEIKDQANMASYGSFEAYWGSFYSFIANELPVEKDELPEIVQGIMENCGVYWTFEDLVIVSEKPIAIHMKDKKLHNENGLALEYKDGTGIFAINGNVYNSMLEMKIQENLK